MDQSKILIIGKNGQLGKQLSRQYPRAQAVDSDTFDITNLDQVLAYDYSNINIVINSAAYTDVDGAETTKGRIKAWAINAVGVSNLVKVCLKNNIILVHISSDYVFDGTNNNHSENEQFSPLGVYGQTKAAGDILISLLQKYFIIRTSWVIGDGKNFVRTMLDVAKKGINPSVVSDQIGRLTFTSELVRAIDFLIKNEKGYGTYNVSNGGDPASWADITRKIYETCGYTNTVQNITTKEYYKNKNDIALRPLNSTLNLQKIHKSGFVSNNWQSSLVEYLEMEIKKQ